MSLAVPVAASPDHEIVTTRMLPFPRAHVYAAWTHPEFHARWWGPNGFTNTFFEYDVRPGGQWKFVMHGPDGRDYPNHSVFEDVVPGQRLVFLHVVAPVFRVVATFADEGNGTRLTFRMLFETAELCATVKSYAGQANEENFDRLTAVLAGIGPDAPELRELVLVREINASPDVLWRVWTERLTEWWCPRPWRTTEVRMELRAGGEFSTRMEGPAGEVENCPGRFLEVTPGEKLVFTDAFGDGWQPEGRPFMVGVFTFEAIGGKTRYAARARHWTAEVMAEHETMGFRGGWGTASDQLIELLPTDSVTGRTD